MFRFRRRAPGSEYPKYTTDVRIIVREHRPAMFGKVTYKQYSEGGHLFVAKVEPMSYTYDPDYPEDVAKLTHTFEELARVYYAMAKPRLTETILYTDEGDDD